MMHFCGNNSYVNMPQRYVRSSLPTLFLSWTISKKADKSSNLNFLQRRNYVLLVYMKIKLFDYTQWMLKVLDFTKLYSLSSERKLEYSQSDRC